MVALSLRKLLFLSLESWWREVWYSLEWCEFREKTWGGGKRIFNLEMHEKKLEGKRSEKRGNAVLGKQRENELEFLEETESDFPGKFWCGKSVQCCHFSA